LEIDAIHEYAPYITGLVGAVECANPLLRKKLCPSKPLKGYLLMYDSARELGLRSAATIILGVGETADDIPLLHKLIARYDIAKVHFYSLTPHQGTQFAGMQSPSADYQATWIAATRARFPQLDIQAGIWHDRAERAGMLLTAGADSISKFSSIRYFASPQAQRINKSIEAAGLRLCSNLTEYVEVDCYAETAKYGFGEQRTGEIAEKLRKYLCRMHNGWRNQQ
jgi:biotin synthase-like enzyme